MTKIQGNVSQQGLGAQQGPSAEGSAPKRDFGKVLSKAADVALGATAVVAPLVPGGQIVGMAARGISQIKQHRAAADIATAQPDQMDKMWSMQADSQAFNMQYLQLQQQLQADNRSFSTLSNLLKARHDTAKAAINNMHA